MHNAITPDSTLADLAVHHAGASRVFHRHGLDFCCNGRVSLEEACRSHDLDPSLVAAELALALAASPLEPSIAARPLPEVVRYIRDHYHDAHRVELPRLIAMAHRVEQVHGDKPECPRGLAMFLERLTEELELHMQKEELDLFPMILAGRGAGIAMPIAILEEDHADHVLSLLDLRRLVTDYVPPARACNTWRALYLGLAEFELDLMEHIHLENNALFPRALTG